MSKLDMTCRVDDETPRHPALTVSGPLECQEVENILGDRYVRCARPATMLVYHARDKRTYLMCEMCGEHNVHNRGGELVGELVQTGAK